MAICENLGDYLNRIRNNQGLSISQFSTLLGISRSSLQAILNGTGNPRSDTIEHIADRLNLDYRTLLSGQEQPSGLQLTEQQQKDLLLLLNRFSDFREADHE